MNEYTCYTNRGKWRFNAYSDIDAMRLALYYCWRDGEDFIKVEIGTFSRKKTLCICVLDERNMIQTL